MESPIKDMSSRDNEKSVIISKSDNIEIMIKKMKL